mmetsp:Transcript_10486/g.28874  ORF Transcript_10486/g.28874 Transcript_10486/m.28874 type:complete len:224 (-) Transcript_10486:11-682(-)
MLLIRPSTPHHDIHLPRRMIAVARFLLIALLQQSRVAAPQFLDVGFWFEVQHLARYAVRGQLQCDLGQVAVMQLGAQPNMARRREHDETDEGFDAGILKAKMRARHLGRHAVRDAQLGHVADGTQSDAILLARGADHVGDDDVIADHRMIQGFDHLHEVPYGLQERHRRAKMEMLVIQDEESAMMVVAQIAHEQPTAADGGLGILGQVIKRQGPRQVIGAEEV